jgi:hypothetical protein
MMPSLPLVGEEFANYSLRAVLGRGGMSVVFEAENPRLGSTIALKVISPELSADDLFRSRFLKESRVAASLNHPHVIPIYDAGPCGELLYIAMRFVAGSDLRAVLKADNHLSPEQALLLVDQTGRALDAAHRHGLVHRDVKPANILIERGASGEPDHVYLADFGITKHAMSRSGLTATGEFVGTIDYIAPEQIRGQTVDGRADIYSLGCVLYQALTGQVPFAKDLDAAVIWAHVEELPIAPSAVRPDLPAGIDDVIARALAKDPDDRFATCRDFLLAAYAAVQSQGSRAGQADAPASVLADLPAADQATETVNDGPDSYRGQAAAPLPADGRAHGERTHGDAPPPRVPRGSRAFQLAIGGMVVALLIAVGAIVWGLSRGARSTPAPTGEARRAALAAVPDNHVHGSGTAMLRLSGDTISVAVDAEGLLNGAPHLMHIHAGGLGTCPPASAARLHNGHLAISTTDGIRYYGPVEASLTTTGDTSPGSYLSFERSLSSGDIRYRRTFKITSQLAAEIRANRAVVVIHGIDYDGRGIYDNVLSHSELLATDPAEATAPALCGALTAASATASATPGSPSSTGLYVAALSVESAALAAWCEAAGDATPTAGVSHRRARSASRVRVSDSTA